MNIQQTYDYLIRARRDLWRTLESVPDEVLARPLLHGARLHCIKDLVFHIADVEDGWLHGELLHDTPVQKSFPSLAESPGGPAFADVPLALLLDYWRAVEQSTLAYLATLNDAELNRLVDVEDDDVKSRFTVDGLLWHVLIHEMRHTAQIAVLLRTQEIKPPSLDLLFYLPSA